MDWTNIDEIQKFHERVFGTSLLSEFQSRKTHLISDEFTTKLPLNEKQKIYSNFLKFSSKTLLSLGAGFGKTAICLGYFGLLNPEESSDEQRFKDWKKSLKEKKLKKKKSWGSEEVDIDSLDIFSLKEDLATEDRCNFKAIVVAPASLLKQWCSEIEKFTWFTYVEATGNKDSRSQIYKDFSSDNTNILVLNFEKVLKDYPELLWLSKQGIDTIVFDEPTQLMNSSNTIFKGWHRITSNIKRCVLVTATPLVNNLSECYNLCQILHLEKLLPGQSQFEENFLVFKKFKVYKGLQSFEVKQPKGSKNIKAFRALVDPFLIYEDAADNPNLKKIKCEFKTISVPYSEEQAYLCEQIKNDLQSTYKSYEDYLGKKAEFDYLSQIAFASDPKLVARYHELEDALKINPEVPRITTAYQNFLKATAFPKLFDDSKSILSPKINELLKFIINNKQKKFIIYSQFLEAHQYLKDILDSKGIKHLEIDGTMSAQAREDSKNKFNNSQGDCFNAFNVLIMSKAGRFGLNLQAGSEVILLSMPFTPSDVQQLLARCYRTGVQHDVTLWFFVTKNSIDEEVFDKVLLRKQLEFDEFTDSNNSRIFSSQKVVSKNSFIRRNYLQGPFYDEQFIYEME